MIWYAVTLGAFPMLSQSFMIYSSWPALLLPAQLSAIRFNRAGEPPPLSRYLSPSWAVRYPEIRNTRRVFVPVGLNLPLADARGLRRRTSWNATLHRTMHLTRSMAVYEEEEPPLLAAGSSHAPAALVMAPSRASSSQPRAADVPHTLASLLDLSICREAGWVMGWSG